GRDMVLEIVVSTDGIEPLFFITSDDLTYQARCPLNEAKRLGQNTDHISSIESDTTNDNFKMIASAHALFSMLANETKYRQLSSISQNLSVKHIVTTEQRKKKIIEETLHLINNTTDINTLTIKLITSTLATIIAATTATTTTTTASAQAATTTTTIIASTSITDATAISTTITATTTIVPTQTVATTTTIASTSITDTTTISTPTTTTIASTSITDTTTISTPTTTTIASTSITDTTTISTPTTTTTLTIATPTLTAIAIAETVKLKPDSTTDEYDENTNSTIGHSRSSTNSKFEIYTSITNKIIPEEIINNENSEKLPRILDVTSAGRSAILPEVTLTSENSGIFSKTEILDNLIATATTTIQKGNDVILNEAEQKHESTKISPINETKNLFLGSNSSTLFTNSHITTLLVPGSSSVTSTTFIDSSSTISTIEALPIIYASNEIIHRQSVYNTIITSDDMIETFSSTLPTTMEFVVPTILSDIEQNSANTETLSSLSSLPSSLSSSSSSSSSSPSSTSSSPSSTSTSSSSSSLTATTMADIIAATTTITLTEITTTTAATTTTATTTLATTLTTAATTTTITPIGTTETTTITAETIRIIHDHPIIATLQVPLSTIVAEKDDNDVSIQSVGEIASTNVTIGSYSANKSIPHVSGTGRATKDAVIFDIFHNGQPVEAVVVGSKITLSFIPYYAIPPIYMSIKGCQVEPIGSLYEWEREPLAIIKDGCQADHVGLVCPPQKTEYGIRVTAESFRYQTTSRVQYSCLVRICPFAPCPMEKCEEVEGCGESNLLSNTFGLRSKRHITIEEIRAALAANPDLQRQIRLMNRFGTQGQTTSEMQQQLIELGGDHVVKKQLVVVNSEDELRYYVRTGDVP
ncbi:unnamed protein product, partial [Cercopithifilaria johnstoni]